MKRLMLPGVPARNRKRYAEQVFSSVGAQLVRVEDPSLGEVADLSDSLAAAEAIIREVSSTSGFPLAIPGCFAHQVYAIIKDKTVVNQELQGARVRQTIRHLHIEGCGVLLVRERDYRQLLDALIDSAERDVTAETELNVLRSFRDNVIDHWNELGISQQKLFEMMGRKEEERLVTLMLLRLGFLVFQTHGIGVEQDPAFWFALPNMRTFILEVEGARKEILNMIKTAKPHRELLKSKLFAKGKLKSSSMSIDFHIKDVIGARLVVCKDTALEGKNSLFLLPDKLTF